METRWQLQDAKNKLSEVVQRAQQGAAQVITLRGKPAAVIVDYESYRKLVQPRESLLEFFQSSPLAGQELEIERSTDQGRDVEL